MAVAVGAPPIAPSSHSKVGSHLQLSTCPPAREADKMYQKQYLGSKRGPLEPMFGKSLQDCLASMGLLCSALFCSVLLLS